MFTMPFSEGAPAWALLHDELRSTANLVYGVGARPGTPIAEAGAPSLEVALPPALSGFLLALFAARVLDERHGFTRDAGCRSLAEIGRMLAVVPGPGNPVEPDTVGGYKRALARRVRDAARGDAARGTDFAPPPLVVHPGYGRGYALAPTGLVVRGVDVPALLAAVEALRQRRPRAARS